MPTIQDKEFGKITIRRSANASHIKIRVAPDGSLRASMPLLTPIFLLKSMIATSRPELRRLVVSCKPKYELKDGMQIGKSHTLLVKSTTGKFEICKDGRRIIAKVPVGRNLNEPVLFGKIRETMINTLRSEAKSYLPRRLSYLAEKNGFSYQKVRFSHAGSRWGSCSSHGTISLNIALMKLPFELIDYVIVHELAHTKQMNHGKLFWDIVAQADPKYKLHRKLLKSQNPSI